MLMDSSIAEVPTVISLQGYWDMKKKDIENTLMDRLLTYLLHTMILISIVLSMLVIQLNGLLIRMRIIVIMYYRMT